MKRLLVSVLASALALGACAPPPANTPDSAIDGYSEAIAEERYEDAYKMLSTESRGQISLKAFRALIENNPDEVRALLETLKQQKAPPRVTAKVTAKDGTELLLIYENGAWRIDEAAVDLYAQGEPQQALRSFVRAYDDERYDILLNFVPDAQREGLSEKQLRKAWQGEQRAEVESIVEGLRTHTENASIEVVGERATMSYGAGGVVELLRENGSWKIEDFK